MNDWMVELYAKEQVQKFTCCTCNEVDKEGLISGMCTNCFDFSLDIGKPDSDEKKKKVEELRKRRIKNGYYNKE